MIIKLIKSQFDSIVLRYFNRMMGLKKILDDTRDIHVKSMKSIHNVDDISLNAILNLYFMKEKNYIFLTGCILNDTSCGPISSKIRLDYREIKIDK